MAFAALRILREEKAAKPLPAARLPVPKPMAPRRAAVPPIRPRP
jgi:hypothetical protein